MIYSVADIAGIFWNNQRKVVIYQKCLFFSLKGTTENKEKSVPTSDLRNVSGEFFLKV